MVNIFRYAYLEAWCGCYSNATNPFRSRSNQDRQTKKNNNKLEARSVRESPRTVIVAI